jgi:hypothetical protein
MLQEEDREEARNEGGMRRVHLEEDVGGPAQRFDCPVGELVEQHHGLVVPSEIDGGVRLVRLPRLHKLSRTRC